jgi:hypothetical protein
MRLRDPELLKGFMAVHDCSQSRLSRKAGCSRQFVHLLVTGQRRSCSEEIAARIEDCLTVLPGTLFAPSVSPTAGHSDLVEVSA